MGSLSHAVCCERHRILGTAIAVRRHTLEPCLELAEKRGLVAQQIWLACYPVQYHQEEQNTPGLGLINTPEQSH